jgi:hypothetical protein
MATRDDLCDWVIEALKANGGRARIVEICTHIWEHHESDLRKSGDLFYTWQYDVRWAGQKLRDDGTLMPANGNRSAPWVLKK